MARSLKMGQIWNRIRDIFPDAGYNESIAMYNDELIDLAVRLGKMRMKTHKMNAVSGKMFYDLSDEATNLGINKIYRVDFLNSVDQYRMIPRVVDGKSLSLYDET